MKTLGTKINEYRKARGLTQEDLAERLNVSPQAVSKWENDLSIPDLPTLIGLADLFGVTIDELVRQYETLPVAQMLPEEQRKPIDRMLLRLVVDSSDGDHVNITIPLPIVKLCLEMGVSMPQISGSLGNKIKEVDWGQLLAMADKGVIGRLLEVQSADGDHVEIYVE